MNHSGMADSFLAYTDLPSTLTSQIVSVVVVYCSSIKGMYLHFTSFPYHPALELVRIFRPR